jgi:hypothetical protein
MPREGATARTEKSMPDADGGESAVSHGAQRAEPLEPANGEEKKPGNWGGEKMQGAINGW